VRVDTAIPLASLRPGVFGITDLVEVHRGKDGRWHPFPVEHKRGKRNSASTRRGAVIAQAMALEETLDTSRAEVSCSTGRPADVVPLCSTRVL
jgi:CRISPR-associated exonuclease Cas4